MTRRRLPEPGFLLLVVTFIVMRQALGGQPVFRCEFVAEAFILLLTVTFGLGPSRFKPLTWCVINCSMSITMALITWTIAASKLPLAKAIVFTAVFAVLATYSAALAVIELSKLRKDGRHGVPPQ